MKHEKETDLSPALWCFTVGCLFLIMTLLFAIPAYFDHKDYIHDANIYCDNVETWHETDGQFGWPPYKGECK